MHLFCLTAVFLSWGYYVSANPNGAPEQACLSMTPGHGFPAQNVQANSVQNVPFLVTITPKSDGLTYAVKVTRNTNYPGRPTLKGFLIQVREVGSAIALGEFVNLPSFAKNGGCRTGSVTHTSNDLKPIDNGLEFTWSPKNLVSNSQNLQVLGTFVQDFSTYWVQLASNAFKANGATVAVAPVVVAVPATVGPSGNNIVKVQVVTKSPNGGAQSFNVLYATGIMILALLMVL